MHKAGTRLSLRRTLFLSDSVDLKTARNIRETETSSDRANERNENVIFCKYQNERNKSNAP
jgi:hypothetical protein